MQYSPVEGSFMQSRTWIMFLGFTRGHFLSVDLILTRNRRKQVALIIASAAVCADRGHVLLCQFLFHVDKPRMYVYLPLSNAKNIPYFYRIHMCSVFQMLWCHVNAAYCPKTKCGQSHLITNLSSCWTHIKSPKSKPVWSKPHEASQKIRPVCDVRQLLEQIIRIKSRKGQGWRMPRVIIFNTVSMSCWEIRHCRKGQNAKGNMHSNVKNNTSKCGKKALFGREAWPDRENV